jgi:DNA-binding transcriptional LysR family regulator
MDIGSFDLNAVRVFVAVVEHGGFREAAAQLKQPKSTVSRRVADLEASLGQQLLRRTTRTVSLTEVGDSFFRQASQSLASLSDAVRTVQEAEATPRGLLKVTAPPTFAELFLGDLIARFSREYPEVRIVLDLNDRFVDLVAEGFDVALRAGTLPDSTLKARLLGTAPVSCYASREYLQRRGTPTSPDELSKHDVIAFGTDERQVKWPFVVKKAKTLVSLKPRFTLNSFVLIEKLARAGLGVARIPGGLVQTRGTELVEVLQDFAPPPAPMHAVFPPSQHVSPKVRVFLDFVSQHLETPGWTKVKPTK